MTGSLSKFRSLETLVRVRFHSPSTTPVVISALSRGQLYRETAVVCLSPLRQRKGLSASLSWPPCSALVSSPGAVGTRDLFEMHAVNATQQSHRRQK